MRAPAPIQISLDDETPCTALIEEKVVVSPLACLEQKGIDLSGYLPASTG